MQNHVFIRSMRRSLLDARPTQETHDKLQLKLFTSLNETNQVGIIHSYNLFCTEFSVCVFPDGVLSRSGGIVTHILHLICLTQTGESG